MVLKTDSISDQIFGATQISEAALIQLLPDFFIEIKEDYRFMATALANQNLNEVKLRAHKIKGTASSYGAIKVAACSLQIQNGIEHAHVLGPLAEKLDALIAEAEAYAKNVWGI